MAFDQLSVHDGEFARVGVRVDFNYEQYDDLLNELTDTEEVEAPHVEISPAWVWLRQTVKLNSATRFVDECFTTPKEEAGGRYDYRTDTISVAADEDVDLTNSLLLQATRTWSLVVNQEVDGFGRYNLQSSFLLRQAGRALTVGAGTLAGVEIDGSVGGTIGFGVGLVAVLLSAAGTTPAGRAAEFAEDKRILSDYGDIISYSRLYPRLVA